MKKDMRNKIVNAFTSQTPNLKSKVIQKCESQEQSLIEPVFLNERSKKIINMRFIFACSLVLLFAFGIFTGFAISNKNVNPEAQTILYLETDASIEIALDENNKVISCKPLNQTAQNIVEGMDLKGWEISSTLNAILGSMCVKGYINSANNSMLVSVVNRAGLNNAQMLSTINEQINSIFVQSDMKCSLIVQSVSISQDLETRAKEQGISVGKMFLIDKMAQEFDETQEEAEEILSDLPIRDLNLIYSNRRPQGSNDIISGAVGGFISEEVAWLKAMEFAGTSIIQANVRSVKVSLSNREVNKVVYLVELEIKENSVIKRYEVDCTTGEVYNADQFGYSLR